MIEYILGGVVIWVISGLLTLHSVCRPIFDGDTWDKPDFIVCGLLVLFGLVLFGPFSQVIAIKEINKAHLEYIEKGYKK